jgi:uncharacterized protein HemX
MFGLPDDFWHFFTNYMASQFLGFLIALALGLVIGGILLWLGIQEQNEKEAEKLEKAKREEEDKKRIEADNARKHRS